MSDPEIQLALFHMGPHKASGPDCYSAPFFQKFWPYVNHSVLQLIVNIFLTRDIPMGLNESIICLLPKCLAPETLNQFCPISLCNVLVKVVTKVLANQLKQLISKLTRTHQASFIPERLTLDNIIAAQEVVHTD